MDYEMVTLKMKLASIEATKQELLKEADRMKKAKRFTYSDRVGLSDVLAELNDEADSIKQALRGVL